MRDRKIFLILSVAILFAFLVVVWYFFKASPASNPDINNPTNPFGPAATSRPRGEFINNFINGFLGNNNTTNDERIPASERTLTQIWDKPTAGYNFVNREIIIEGTSTPQTGTSTIKKLSKPTKKTVEYLLFVDRITGHIYGYNKDSAGAFQITNTTIPGIYDAYITQNGSKVFLRYFDKDTNVIKTIMATIPTFLEGADPRPLTDLKSLQENISSFAVSDSSNYFSYIVPNNSGSSIYTVDSKNVATTFNSPLREWSLVYGGEIPYITNKASAYLEGSSFSLPKNIYNVGGKTGLVSLPNKTGESILSSMWSNSGLLTFISSKKTGSLTTLSIKTIASKCAWMDNVRLLCGVPSTLISGEEGLPDDWFQGSLSFSDDLFLVNINNGLSYTLLSLTGETGNPFDIIRPQINKVLTSLVFTNKQNGGLWLVNLNRLLSSTTSSQ
ncbi:MAG: hypothetical protein NTW35_00450 [Candidatus Nomurabacteria bacterium]|nr:hypothetical protein [Candidatus Nomurabacteria bacterium]